MMFGGLMRLADVNVDGTAADVVVVLSFPVDDAFF